MAQIACQKGFKTSMPRPLKGSENAGVIIDLFCSQFPLVRDAEFESGSGSCWAKGAIEDALKKKRRSLPYTMKSSVSSAEIPVGQYVVSQRQYLECLTASPSLEFVDKKMQKHCIKGWLYSNSGCYVLTHDHIVARRKMTQDIPGSSKYVKCLPFGRCFS